WEAMTRYIKDRLIPPMKIMKNILKYALAFIAILAIVILFPILSYKKETNTTPLPSYYKKGVYHMHTVFSDGKGTIDDITRAAHSLGLDFVILTDHGRPNRKSAKATAYLNDVLLVGASEFSLQAGHLAAAGFKIPGYIFPPEPQEAINEVLQDKGVCFISHPYDGRIPWTDWDVRGFTGIEILTCYRSAGGIPFFKLLSFPLQYLVNSNYSVLNTLEYPRREIRKWDSLNLGDKRGHYYGIYALDAHGRLAAGGKFELNFPSYGAMFEILNIYVKVDRELPANAQQASSIIISSLRQGNFFSAIEAIAPANGFEAYFLDNSGQRVEMGGSSPLEEGKLVILLPFNFETEIVVKRDGQVYQKVERNREKKCEIGIKGPGFYGIEVFVTNNKFNRLPWILSNPFFIGINKSFFGVVQGRFFQKKPLVNEKGFFTIEKNSGSKGTIVYGQSEKGELITTFGFKLDKDESAGKDFWSVLAARKRFDFSGYQGICFEAQSERKLRFWVEARTGESGKESWYRHSFLVKKGWKEFYIPFEKFNVFFGERKKLDLTDIQSIFFSINNASAYPGTRGRIDFKNIGLY
ncbi:MAG: POLIIIAc protein, partial [Acidobacteriota bacterium]|nr:POLIIIAc protein [Acidobacteriota bacterium]